MKLYSNILFPLTKPWAIKAAGQPFVYFDYNAAGDNIRVYSSIANDWERIYTYDLLGRKLTYTEGNIVENYAYTGNLLTLHTQQYYDNNVSTPITSQTTYTYNAHRLQSVNGQDEVPVVYHYDNCGRVDTLYDESGLVCYQYGNMGEITRETRIYTVPFLSNIIAMNTQFEYDSWGRILNITYPDNEIVSYDYDCGGQLERIANNQNYTYLDSIHYNKFGAKISQKYGNGIQTKYTYYPLTQRLDSLLTTCSGNTLSYLQYNYDSVGNILRVNSSYPMPQYQVTERYSYDSADQLLTAESTCNNNVLCSGAYTYNNWGKINTYTQQTTDPATNITENKNYRYYFPGSNADMAQGQTSFAPIIKYDMQQNQQLLETCTYGINGSIRKRYDHQTQNTDYYYFNASGNLKACGTDMQISLYGYNAANTRTYKVNMFNANQWINGQPQPIQPMVQSAMFYPNTYINFTQAGEYTKHYYNGTERICSRLGEQQVSVSVENNQECEAYQNDVKQIIYNAIGQHLYDEPADMQEGEVFHLEFLQPCGNNNAVYYYHPNHLASSMYVTDVQQFVVQSFLYAPYGEIISEYNTHVMGDAFPKYAFNAKEFDEETGMYYYEARYMAPPMFISRDPLFEKYFFMSPYAYCANNPVKLTDPDGRWIPGLDEENNIIVTMEDGDDYNSFKSFMGNAYSEESIKNMYEQMQDGTINLTKTYGGVFQLMTDAINDAYNDPDFERYDNYNCWGAAIALTSGSKLSGPTSTNKNGVGIGEPYIFDGRLRRNYEQVNPEAASVGVTVMRFGKPTEASHGAVYLGKDRNGNEYAFTKNGWYRRPKISPVSSIVSKYGPNCSKSSYFDAIGTSYMGKGYYNHKPPKEKTNRKSKIFN